MASSICLVVVNPGKVHMECAESVTGVVTTETALWAFYHRSGPYIDMPAMRSSDVSTSHNIMSAIIS